MGRYDFHSHILPGADHGSRDLATSLAQGALLLRQGTDHVVATPHFYPHADSVTCFLERRNVCAEALIPFAEEHADRLSVFIGAEVLVCEGMERMEGLERLTICGTNTLLLEMPMQPWTDTLLYTVKAISRMGFRVVVAHIDRYSSERQMRLLEEEDLQFQLNPTACGIFGLSKMYLSLIDEGRVAAVGSDLHGTKGYTSFLRMLRRMGFARTEAVMRQSKELLQGAIPLHRWHVTDVPRETQAKEESLRAEKR